jgi:hypothetical protein
MGSLLPKQLTINSLTLRSEKCKNISLEPFMRLAKFTLLAVFCCINTIVAGADISLSNDSDTPSGGAIQVGLNSNKNYGISQISGKQANNKNLGLGIRLGDPAGITLKKYNKGSAFEIILGRSQVWGWRGYYNRRYKHLDDWRFRNRFPISLQLHYLIQKPIADVPGLDWYVGFGGQLRYSNYYVVYKSGRNTIEERYTDIDLGVDILGGIEYTFKDAPISMFFDINLFVEILDNPMMIWPQAGFGVRFNF